MKKSQLTALSLIGMGMSACAIINSVSAKGADKSGSAAVSHIGGAAMLKPENKAKLAGILTYHVVSGNVSAADLTKMIKDGNGKATLKTVQGEELTAALKGKKVELTDVKGNIAEVTQADVKQSNGVIHVINKVLMP